jgi:prophage regulatory protein
MKDLMKKIGLSHTTIWRLEKRGQFPKSRRLSPRRIGWVVSEIDEWVENGGYYGTDADRDLVGHEE